MPTPTVPEGWTAESGLVAGSRKFTHPTYRDWMIYDTGAGGVITVYREGFADSPTFASIEAAAEHIAIHHDD